jgi:SHS2 domain-containing protein
MPLTQAVREWVDHTGELELHVWAPTVCAVFEEASLGLAEALGGRSDEPAVERQLRVEGPDLAALLAIWLDELVWLAEHESLIVERVEVANVGDGVASGTVIARSGQPRALVKAVTYHGLSCERDGDRWRATVVFDV